MKKVTSTIFGLVAAFALVGCSGGGESVDASSLVSTAINNPAILIYNNRGMLNTETIELDGNTEETVTITTQLTVSGHPVGIQWVPNSGSVFSFGAEDDNHHIVATPNYPEVGGDNIGATLTAKAIFDGVESDPMTYTFVFKAPEKKFEKMPLSEIRTKATSKERVWVEGQVTAIMPDFDIAYIQENGYAIGLYKLSTSGSQITLLDGSTRDIQIGDYVKAIGEYSPYNGLAEVSLIESLVEVEKPAGFELGEVKTLTGSDFEIDPMTQMFPVTNYDGTLVQVNGLEFVKFTDKDGNTISALPTDGKTHSNIVCMLGDTQVSIYVSYHIGSANQTAIAGFFSSLAAGAKFNYSGILGWYTNPNLGIISVSDLALA